ncbi:MAG: hypothetical protein QW597_01485 [Thermoplasmataceae archaeon]
MPDGGPTLDHNLEGEIETLGRLEIKITVITNSSPLHREDVMDAFSGAN